MHVHKVGVALAGLGVDSHQRARDWLHQDDWIQIIGQLERYVLDDSCSLIVGINFVKVDGEVSDYKKVEVLTARGEGERVDDFRFGESQLDLLGCLIRHKEQCEHIIMGGQGQTFFRWVYCSC